MATETTNLGITHVAAGATNKIPTLADGFNEFDSAIAGLVSKDMVAADVTLTAAEAKQNMFIELTGAITAARTLNVPAQRKLYVIRNSCTDGGGGPHTVTFKVTGQTGFAVTAAKWTIAMSNGTDTINLAEEGAT